MLDILFWVAVGCIVGWHVPMPPWAKWGINWMRTKLGMGPMDQ